METYGLVGKKLSHSFSPRYFNEKFQKSGIKAEYLLFEIDSAERIPEIILQNPGLKGLNVTVPYKKQVLAFLHYTDQPAREAGAVNTIKINRKNKEPELRGYNTDIVGFEYAIQPFLKFRVQLKALVLGTGGSAVSLAWVLKKLGIPFVFVSRFPKDKNQMGYPDIDTKILEEYKLIVNATPVGMYPDTDRFPQIPYDLLSKDHILFDLIYNPGETLFLKMGKEKGAVISNGLEMLKMQAEASWNIWRKP